MTLGGFVLITVSLANALTAQADCCNCNCQPPPSSFHHQPQLYYYPVLPTNHLGIHQTQQTLGAISLENIAHVAKVPVTQVGYQHIGGYAVTEQGGHASLEIENQLQGQAVLLDHQHQNVQQQQLYSNEDSGHLDSSLLSHTVLHQPKFSKVSTHQDSHYINIEKHISPAHSGGENSHEHKDHHGKNDYYKFEYAVNNKKTHDIKAHKEEKKGDVVRGEYSLVEDDGNVRTVKYYADWKNGFHARVHNTKDTPLG